MNYFNYNDNEVIYLIRLGNENAYNFLNKKYKKFIYSKIKQFHLHDVEDSYQEGLIALFNAVRCFNETYEKTFNKYFERVLKNRLLDVKRKDDNNYEVIISEKLENNKFVLKESNYNSTFRLDDIFNATKYLNEKEKKIFHLLYIDKYSVLEVSSRMNIEVKSLYKIIYQIKKKIKKNVIQ